jgi:hypothetical protein
MVVSRLIIEFLIMLAGAFFAVATAAFGLATFKHTLVLDKIQNKIQDDNVEFERKVKKNIEHNLGKINLCFKEIKYLKAEIKKIKGEPIINNDEIDSYFESGNIPDHTNWNS